MSEHFSVPGCLASLGSSSLTKSRSYLVLSSSCLILSYPGPSPEPQSSHIAWPGDLPKHEHDQLTKGLPQQLQPSFCGQNCIQIPDPHDRAGLVR